MGKLWKIIVALLAVAVLLLIIVEIGLRVFISNRVEENFPDNPATQEVESAEVNFGPTPLVFGLLMGRLPAIEIEAPSSLHLNENGVFTGIPAVHVQLENMSLSQDLTADHANASVILPEDYLLAILREQVRQQFDNQTMTDLVDRFGITGLVAQKDNQTVRIELAQGAATIDVAVTAENGAPQARVVESAVLGFTLPEEASNGLSNALQQALAEQQNLLRGFRLENFEVIEGGILATVAADDIPLRELAESAPVQQ